MIAYFTASIVGKKHHLHKYLNIIKTLQSKGVEVISDQIINTTEDKIRFSKKSDRLKFHKQLQDWVHQSDFMIVEASFPSISVGYEISMALHSGKPVLVLYSEGDPPSLLQDMHEDKMACEKYDAKSLAEIIDDFLLYVKGAADLRFTFFISPKISTYLTNISRKRKIPKSVYLRYLIEQDIKKLN